MVPEALTELWAGLTRASALAELAVVGLCMPIAWGVVRRVRGQAPGSIWFGEHGVDGVLFPLLALALVVVARYGLAAVMPVALLRLAVAILAAQCTAASRDGSSRTQKPPSNSLVCG